jgi:ubiquitin C-terminal hydrolase
MSIETKLRGFANLGNTCYMNAALQALLTSNVMNTAILYYIQEMPKALEKFSPVLIAYCKIILDMVKKEPQRYNPSQFKNVIDRENDMFRGHAQHDSHEFMVYAINEFADEKKDKGISKIIRELCFGEYKQYVCCNECLNVSESCFNFLDVVLPIPDLRNPDLEDCFKKFAKCESLDEKNKWMCPTCKKNVIAHKKMEIHKVPEVAIFTFNRFIGMTKNNVPINIYESIELEGKKLKLIATVNHYGSTGGGHYVAHVSRGNKWYRADDSSISEISLGSLLNNPSVYMVVYQVDC